MILKRKVFCVLVVFFCLVGSYQVRADGQLPPVRAITKGLGFHWFAYYDKLQFDPSGRYVLGMEVDFEGRSPRAGDTIKIGMVDLEDGDKWIELGTSSAWGWQQGCMLQWRPGSRSEILYNDREDGRYVCRILDVFTRKVRTVDHPIYSVSPNGRVAVSADFRRIQDMRPGYGYTGLADPYKDQLAPTDSGIFLVDLDTGKAKLIVSLAQAAKIAYQPDPGDCVSSKHWFNHLLFNTDGTRFIFLNRWRAPGQPATSRYRTRMFTAALDGSDIRLIDGYGKTSHFIWRDATNILAWAWHPSHNNAFYLYGDGTGKVDVVGKDVMPHNGHCTYLPGNEWILNDTYPSGSNRQQNVYLYNVNDNRRISLGGFSSAKKYSGEWRCDTHPRFSPDGKMVCIDSPHGGNGRQLYLIDISGIVGSNKSNIGHAQGEMAGAVTANSVILQSRLSKGDKAVEREVVGSQGVGCFEIATDKNFRDSFRTKWIEAVEGYDYIIKTKVDNLKSQTRYYYRLVYGPDRTNTTNGRTCTFRTLGGKAESRETKVVVVTGMNYMDFHDSKKAYKGADKHLGYPALETIRNLKPDYFVGTGDNVYFDKPSGKKAAKTESQLRQKYHEQFVQPRFVDLFAEVATYWEKDDHDHRYNDCDRTGDKLPSSDLGIRIFKEQLPVVDPDDDSSVTYGTYRISKDLQIWLVEGRDYRSPNKSPDGPDKTIWGKTQKQWLKDTLLKSDATYKILISPTPMIGPDDAYKTDNHTNHEGFRYEGDEFKKWLKENSFEKKGFYFICGDRHWQYHSIDPAGLEEFSSGALVDANSRVGRLPGDPKSTDPKATITQPYCMQKPSGGFVMFTVTPGDRGANLKFEFFDERGKLFYSCSKTGR